jgi:hypothetical protein
MFYLEKVIMQKGCNVGKLQCCGKRYDDCNSPDPKNEGSENWRNHFLIGVTPKNYSKYKLNIMVCSDNLLMGAENG